MTEVSCAAGELRVDELHRPLWMIEEAVLVLHFVGKLAHLLLHFIGKNVCRLNAHILEEAESLRGRFKVGEITGSVSSGIGKVITADIGVIKVCKPLYNVRIQGCVILLERLYNFGTVLGTYLPFKVCKRLFLISGIYLGIIVEYGDGALFINALLQRELGIAEILFQKDGKNVFKSGAVIICNGDGLAVGIHYVV